MCRTRYSRPRLASCCPSLSAFTSILLFFADSIQGARHFVLMSVALIERVSACGVGSCHWDFHSDNGVEVELHWRHHHNTSLTTRHDTSTTTVNGPYNIMGLPVVILSASPIRGFKLLLLDCCLIPTRSQQCRIHSLLGWIFFHGAPSPNIPSMTNPGSLLLCEVVLCAFRVTRSTIERWQKSGRAFSFYLIYSTRRLLYQACCSSCRINTNRRGKIALWSVSITA